MAMSPVARIADTFNQKRRLRSWRNSHFGGLQAAKLHPLAFCKFRPDEGGTTQTMLDIKLAPHSGYMRSKAYVEVVQVFVPYQGVELLLKGETHDDAGVTEMARRRLLQGDGVGLEVSGEIGRAGNVYGKQDLSGEAICESVRASYICAVNHLRKAKYHAATELDDTVTTIQPAVLTASVLDRYNGVLDPERLIDGAINLTGTVPVKGIGVRSNAVGVDDSTPKDVRETGWEDAADDVSYPRHYKSSTDNKIFVRATPSGTTTAPEIYADLAGAAELTLRDMVESYKLDGLIRDFAQMIQDDPHQGEQKVARALYGLSCDYDATPQVMYRKVHELTAQHRRPTDGASINDVSAHFELQTSFATLVPRSELGGQLVTLVAVKPLETMQKQPDPAQSQPWELVNRIHDELQLEEVLLTRGDLESDVALADMDTPVFWVGHNQLEHAYDTQGPNDQQTHATEQKSAMWTYAIPTSVTPENVNYPATIDMYPFFNWNGAHAEYTISQQAAISTTLAKGPTPVEKIELFADDPTLVHEA
jgi:hypothetical protein